MAIAKKGTLLITSGPAHDPERKHLHIVCCDPDEKGNVVIVSVCSARDDNKHDQTCLLQDFEHRFLSHESYVLYREAKITTGAALQAGVVQGVMIPHDPVNGQIFLRVKNGICRSPQTPRKVKNFMGCEAEKKAELEPA